MVREKKDHSGLRIQQSINQKDRDYRCEEKKDQGKGIFILRDLAVFIGLKRKSEQRNSGLNFNDVGRGRGEE